MDVKDTGNPKLNQKLTEWLSWDKDENTLSEIKALLDEENFDILSEILLKRLSFGTAGLRGKIGAGYFRMNDLVVVQTAQGLLKHLEEYDLVRLNEKGIVIGYDGRYKSKRFAELTATIFLQAGKPVYLFSTTTPTPFVPFSVSKWNLSCGVMVTASHNPKEDNGYKVYGWKGAQIISPIDSIIQKKIKENIEPWPTSWNTEILNSNPLLRDPLEEVLSDYTGIINTSILDSHKEINRGSPLLFTYTALHGVGFPAIAQCMEIAGLKIVPVEEQKNPDPEFPTVEFPNPEEGKSALDLSFKTAEENSSTIILANDPDADRLAVAEKNKMTGEWKVFNGNQIGALFGWWVIKCYKERYPGKSLDDVYMMASTVSSKILRSIANVEKCQFVETLTGFKWIGTQTYNLLQEGKTVIFAFEEAIGFMVGSAVLDKDGVSAAVQMGTMAAYLEQQGITLCDQLDNIYNQYGHHISNNSYFICHDPVLIKEVFDRIRTANGTNMYPESILSGKYEVEFVRDLTTGYDNSQPNKKAILPVSCSIQMITFTFKNGLVATLRTSGTEPKVKYYTELCATPELKDRTEVENILEEMVTALIEEFLEPEKNGFIPQQK